MRPLPRLILQAATGLCLLSCTSSRTATEKEALVDVVLHDYAVAESPGASVVVVGDGTVLYEKSFGVADLNGGRAITSETNFRLASLTKQFTAMAILILVNDLKLSLNDPLTKFFPGFPGYGSGITVRHLLNHTSGILDYEPLLPDTQSVQIRDRDVLRLLSALDTVYFRPGEEYRYSNSGYALLALIVEKTSGQSLAEFLKARIFAPLGMTGSVAFEEGISSVPNRAFGYSRTDTGWIFSDQSSTSAVLGDGGIYTSISDLLLWDHSLSVGYLVPLYLLRECWKPATLNDGSTTEYGFGWALNLSGRYPRHSHTGSTRGFRNIIVRYPIQHLTIIILTNRNEGDLTPLAEEIAEVYFD
jgi:CubicO group peptidase (beta-lactamase class C family)